MTARYLLVTPCRDEERFGRRTLDAVVAQTLPPALWIIVDDGSKDGTPALLAEYASRHDFIRVIRRADRGDRKLGGGVIDAFYTGYDAVDPAAYDYVCKLDLDLDLPPGYFEGLVRRMEGNPRIGTASGKPWFPAPGTEDEPPTFPLVDVGRFVSEKMSDFNSVGMTKFYRTACFRQIGGFVREVMWDGIDAHRCRQHGWIPVAWDDPELRFVHLRPMGTSHKNWWTGRVRHGFGQWYMGTILPYMLAQAAYRSTRPPVLMGGVAMLWGYLKNMAKGTPRHGDDAYRRFVRDYQWACLLQGRRRATEELDARQAAAWRPGGGQEPGGAAGAARAVAATSR